MIAILTGVKRCLIVVLIRIILIINSGENLIMYLLAIFKSSFGKMFILSTSCSLLFFISVSMPPFVCLAHETSHWTCNLIGPLRYTERFPDLARLPIQTLSQQTTQIKHSLSALLIVLGIVEIYKVHSS